jgi:hypothetical protein
LSSPRADAWVVNARDHDHGHPWYAATDGVEDLELPRILVVRHARHVPLVGELGGDAQRPPLAAAADDKPPAGRGKLCASTSGVYGCSSVTGVPRQSADRSGAGLEPVHALAKRRQGDAEHPVLHLVPAWHPWCS